MSNRRRLPGARPRPYCARCGRGIGKLDTRVTLPDGRSVCAGCRDTGVLSRRLSCGHVAMPGMQIQHVGAGVYLCGACSEESAKALKGYGHG